MVGSPPRTWLGGAQIWGQVLFTGRKLFLWGSSSARLFALYSSAFTELYLLRKTCRCQVKTKLRDRWEIDKNGKTEEELVVARQRPCRYSRIISSSDDMFRLLWKWCTQWFISECPENISLSHNASSTTSPSPVHTFILHFNESIALALQCAFDTAYANQTMYKWYVNGVDVNHLGSSFDCYFTGGDYIVTCEAWYQLPQCDTCRRTRSVYVSVPGKKTRRH